MLDLADRITAAQGPEIELMSAGSGIGLAIARAIAEAHGGTIEAFSPGRGAGTTIEVWLPRDR